MTSTQVLKTVTQNIKRLRIARKLSQPELAKRAKCSASMICRLEKAERDISLSLMTRIANSLDVGIRQLIEKPRAREQGTEIHEGARHLEVAPANA